MQRQTFCIWRHQLGWGSLMLKVALPMRLWMMRQQVIYLPLSIALEVCSFYCFFNLLRQISSSLESFFKSYLLSKKERTLHMMFKLLKSWDKTAISAKNATPLLHAMMYSLWLFIPCPYNRMLLFWFQHHSPWIHTQPLFLSVSWSSNFHFSSQGQSCILATLVQQVPSIQAQRFVSSRWKLCRYACHVTVQSSFLEKTQTSKCQLHMKQSLLSVITNFSLSKNIRALCSTTCKAHDWNKQKGEVIQSERHSRK